MSPVRGENDLALALLSERLAPGLVFDASLYDPTPSQGAAETAAAHQQGQGYVYFSTSEVYAPQSAGLRKESTEWAPQSDWAAHALSAEEALNQACPGAMIFRLGWLFSRTGLGWIGRLRGKMEAHEALELNANHRGQPTPVWWIAQQAAHLSAFWSKLDASQKPQKAGAYHLCCSGTVSQLEVGRELLAALNLKGSASCRLDPHQGPDRQERLSNIKAAMHLGLAQLDWKAAFFVEWAPAICKPAKPRPDEPTTHEASGSPLR